MASEACHHLAFKLSCVSYSESVPKLSSICIFIYLLSRHLASQVIVLPIALEMEISWTYESILHVRLQVKLQRFHVKL